MADRSSDSLGYPVIELPQSVISSTESVIRFMIEQLVVRGRISRQHAARAMCQVLTRESQGSTALGGGTALPHSKSEVPDAIGLIGRSQVPLPWVGPDGIPVREVCLLLTPAFEPREAMRALEETVAVLSGK